MGRITKWINRRLNKEAIKEKVFCIGLHKTGTTTLAHFFEEYGFRATHSTDWISSEYKLKNFDFFSDGGSHFDDINEFDFQKLFESYPKAKFILQTRETKKWIISKLKHAGWNQDTRIENDDINKINHKDWRYKSLLTVQKFIEHKLNYESKVLSFFKERDQSRLIILDITNKAIQKNELRRIVEFLNLRSINDIQLPHANKIQTGIDIPEIVKDHINKTT